MRLAQGKQNLLIHMIEFVKQICWKCIIHVIESYFCDKLRV